MKSLVSYIVLSLTFVFLITSFSYACVGARPMAMGGAFIAVSDDANATYWNPAGLDQKKETREEAIKRVLDELEGLEFTYTGTLHNRDEVNYDDFVSFITPIRSGQQDWGSLGLSFVNLGRTEEDIGGKVEFIGRWYWLSYGIKTFDNLFLGTNLRFQDYEAELTVNPGWGVDIDEDGIFDIIGPFSGSDEDATFGVDLALLWKLDKFSFGILWQNMNEPEVELFGVKIKYIRNLRPGIAFRPDDKTVIALDMYDATGETEGGETDVSQDFRIGIERWFDLPPQTPKWLGDSLALRAGGYHINNRRMRAYTFGFGLKGFPKNNLLKNAHLDYALLYWTDPPPGADEFTHQLGFTFKF